MQSVGSLLRGVLVALAVVLGAGCATIPPNSGQNPADPWETYNRHMFDLNDRVDRAVLKPIAQVYAEYLPEPVRDCVSNVFSNFNDVPNALNNLLQGKPVEAVSDICRVAINSTVGLLGCFDVAGRMGLQRSDEDFGQTLGRWGSAAGPYFVWPFLGPSSVRDAFGRVVGFYTDPVDYLRPIALRNSTLGVRLVDTRAQILPAEKLLDAAALDRYQFIRDAYLQRRNNQVFDGNPPRPKSDEEEDAAADKPAASPAPPPAAPPPDKPAEPPANPPPAPGQSQGVPDAAVQPEPAAAR
ncbi:MAG: VacJ family lipoprotein [Burkholderiaceae bacterium]|nr:VacJ family lipoprotein [Burkholderiaceae bacterium]